MQSSAISGRQDVDLAASVRSALQEFVPDSDLGITWTDDLPFSQLSLTSSQVLLAQTRLQGLLGDVLSIRWPATLFYDFPSITAVTAYLSAEASGDARRFTEKRLASFIQANPVEVLSFSSSFPGGGSQPWSFLQAACRGTHGTTESPFFRWDIYEDRRNDLDIGQAPSRHGAFIDGAELFDNVFFGVSLTEAASMDPQQRVLLECGYQSIRYAGFDRASLNQYRVGVAVGLVAHHCDWEHMVEGDSASNVRIGTSIAPSVCANRVSFCLGFTGTSLTIDSACSSALVATRVALIDLQRCDCEFMLTPSVNLLLSPRLFAVYMRAGMLSQIGSCKTFDSTADGYGRGEGCGVVLMTCNGQLCSEGSLGCLSGHAVNQDGRSASLTAPNGLSQQQLLQSAWIELRRTGGLRCLECHGTGTALGDPVEINATSRALKSFNWIPPLLEATKTGIAHLEGAAGSAGLIRCITSLRCELATPNLHLHQINVHLTEAEWVNASIPSEIVSGKMFADRLSGVSSFGFGGTNAHIAVNVQTTLPTFKHVLSKTVSFHRGSFQWRDPTQKFFDGLAHSVQWVYSDDERKKDISLEKPVVIIGGGMQALQAARELAKHDADYMIFERSDQLGGVWATWANSTSKIQTESGTYHLGMGEELVSDTRCLSSYATRDEVLTHVGSFAKKYDILSHVRLRADVVSVAPHSAMASDQLTVGYVSSESGNESAHVDFTLAAAVFAFPGRLSVPKKVTFPGEEKFDGVVGYGVGDDVAPHQYTARRVAIVGHGAFAVENARTALEHAATSVTIICRQQHRVMPRIASWLINMRSAPVTIPEIVELSLPMYKLTGREPAETGLSQTTLTPVSDVYFLAQFFGKLHIVHSEILDFEPRHIRTSAGENHEAHVFLKCLGFMPNDSIDRVLSLKSLNGIWVNRDHRIIVYREGLHALGAQSLDSTTAFGLLLRILAMAINFLYAPSEFYALVDDLPHDTTSTSFGNFFLGQTMQVVAARVTAVKEQFESIISLKRTETIKNHPLEMFLNECQEDWRRYCELFAAGKSIAWPVFPYTPTTVESYLAEHWVIVGDSHSGQHLQNLLGGPPVATLSETVEDCTSRVTKAMIQKSTVVFLHISEGVEDYEGAEDAICQALLLSQSLLRVLRMHEDSKPSAAGSTQIELTIVTMGACIRGETGVSLSRPRISASGAALMGFARTLRREAPELQVTCFDISNASELHLLPLLRSSRDACAVEGSLWHSQLKPLSLGDDSTDGFTRLARAQHHSQPPNPAALITGGLGALGLVATRAAVKVGITRFWLVSRSGRVGQDEGLHAQLASIQSSPHLQVCLVQCDITDLKAVQEIFNRRIEGEVASFNSVVHSAAVLGPSLIDNYSRDTFCRVLQPQAKGAWNLHLASMSRSLDLRDFVLFSSVMSALGDPGNCAHATASAYMDGLASQRRDEGLPGLSVQFGPISDVGRWARIGRRHLLHHHDFSLVELLPSHAERALYLILRQIQVPSVFMVAQLNTTHDTAHQNASPAARSSTTSTQILDGRRTYSDILNLVTSTAKRTIGFESVEIDAPLMDAGMDSLGAIDFRADLVKTLGGLKISSMLVFNHPSLRQVADYIHGEIEQPSLKDATHQGKLRTSWRPAGSTGFPTSVGSLASRFPANADHSRILWGMLAMGIDAVVEVPMVLWDVSLYYSPDEESGKSHAKHGGFIDGAQTFDATYFGIGPREVRTMDPHQRVMLEVGFEGFLQAGYTRKMLQDLSQRASVIVGQDKHEWFRMCQSESFGPQCLPGVTPCVTANRLSFMLGLQGRSLTLDTACSSTLVALDIARDRKSVV